MSLRKTGVKRTHIRIIRKIDQMKGVCVCCLKENMTLVRVSTCKHTRFLENFTKLEIDVNSAICLICHQLLNTIEMFIKRLERTETKLFSGKKVSAHSKNVINLERSEVKIVSIDGSQDMMTEFKPEPEEPINDSNNFDFGDMEDDKFDIKLNNLDLDYENDFPAAEKHVKTKKRQGTGQSNRINRLQLKSEGKIKLVNMTLEELKKLRDQEAKSERYNKLPYKCTSCLVGFDYELTLKNHMKKHVPNPGGLMCDICLSVLNTRSSYRKHMLGHLRRYECLKCGLRHRSLQWALSHYGQVHDKSVNDQYSCTECGFVANSFRLFKRHKQKHVRKPECKVCGNQFSNASTLRVHMYTVHKKSMRVFECKTCGKVYAARPGLVAHEATHARGQAGNAGGAYCQPCNTHFISERSLKQHLMTHSNHVTEADKRYECHDCGARYATKVSLKDHIIYTHLNTFEHTCNVCSKVFKSASHLKIHVRYVHKKEERPKNKVCDYCGRTFQTVTILRSHIRTHTGEKPHRCTLCTATFAHSASLYNHTKLVHGTKMSK